MHDAALSPQNSLVFGINSLGDISVGIHFDFGFSNWRTNCWPDYRTANSHSPVHWLCPIASGITPDAIGQASDFLEVVYFTSVVLLAVSLSSDLGSTLRCCIKDCHLSNAISQIKFGSFLGASI